MKQGKIRRPRTKLAWLAALTLSFVATRSFAQSVPMTQYTFTNSRGTFSGVLVGGSPFTENPSTVTIDAVLVPLVIQIFKTDGTVAVFDPQNADSSCGDSDSAENRFRHSPLVVPTDLIFNGVNVGKVQYLDGFMQAEFWNVPAPGSPNRSSYFNPLKWSFASAFPLPAVLSNLGVVHVVKGTKCETGVVEKVFFNSLIETFAIPVLQKAGVIAPTKFVLFLTKNVSTAANFSPAKQSDFEGGRHDAIGSPPQTWAWAQFKHTSESDVDILAASHEIGEWMNDPLLSNKSLPWGHIGEVKKCSGKFEVGDPLNRISAPVTLDHVVYHPQELAFFSRFFNADGEPSFGADGKLSSNGRFGGARGTLPTRRNV